MKVSLNWKTVSFYFQHDLIDSKLFKPKIWTRDSGQGAETRDEEALMSSPGEPTNAEAQTKHHHWRLNSLHCDKANDAINEPSHLNTKLNGWASAISWRKRRIFSAVRSEESAMMTNVHLAHGAFKLNLFIHKLIIATIFIVNIQDN